MARKPTGLRVVATLNIKKSPAIMTNREVKRLVGWLRLSAAALLTKERFELQKNYKAHLYEFIGE